MSCWLAHNYLVNTKRLQRFKGNRLLSGFAMIVGVGMLVYIYDTILAGFADYPLLFPEIAGGKRYYILFFRGMLISGLFYFIVYYLHILSEKQKSSLEIEQLKQARLAANLSSLKEQLSPHFLFNTLNTLSTLTQEKEVKHYVAELANVYRYVLQYKEMDTATLQEELAFIASYLYIIKTRLENAIEVNIDVLDNLLTTKIPPLTLQLLIENAIKHNIASSTKQLKIEIRNSGQNHLIVSNNFQPKSSVQHTAGIGLENIMQRYKLLFDKDIYIEKSEATFTVNLPII